MRREYALFFVFNGVGLAIALACLGFSHYVLSLTSPLADNVAANGIGLALGTAFRFTLYKWWVFAPHRSVAHQRSAVLPGRGAVAES